MAQPPLLGKERSVFRSHPMKKLLVLPLIFTLGLICLALFAPLRENPRVLWPFLGVAAALCAWNAMLATSLREGRKLTLEVVLRKQHYMQACGQGLVLLYWGWHWPQVYAFLPFMLAQLLFAY